jgi:S-DNA-T family DNA segregation ATPase FtsK/SpoIIIE
MPPRKRTTTLSGRGRGRPKNGRSRSVIIGVIFAVLVLFTLVSLVSWLLGMAEPETNYGGILGSLIGRGLAGSLGWMSILLPILVTVGVLMALGKQPPWHRFTGFCFIAVGMFLGAGLLSCHTGSPLGTDNVTGAAGAWLAWLLSGLLGFSAYAVPALLILWGFGIWLRGKAPKYLLNSLLVVVVALFLELFLGYFAPEARWTCGPGTGVSFLIAGTAGLAVTAGLRSLLGSVGTFIAIIAGLVLFVALFFTIPLPSREGPLSLLRRITRAARERAARKPRVPVYAPAGETRARTEPQPERPAEDVEPDREPRPAPATTHAVTPPPVPKRMPRKLGKFDLSKSGRGEALPASLQKTFLEQLDQPGPEDMVFKDPRESAQEAERLLEKLRQFGIEGRVSNIVSGPLITRYEFEPAPGIKIQSIGSRADDISLALAAERIRILAPIPGKSAVGIEVPNKERRTVHLYDTITSEAFRSEDSPLGFALGTTITGEPYCADLRTMPHILIAGTTGSGKSVCINAIIASIIYRSSWRDVRFLTIDPKQLELPVYNSIPHLLGQTTIDPKQAVKELDQVVRIMEVRYGEFANLGVRDIAGYNARCEAEGIERKPYIIIVIDELADLMLRAPTEIEERITRLAQMSRAVGIHLLLATQRPSVDVITGLIKANFPCRIAFQVASKTDSRTILDMNGAESLLGQGDMLFLPPGKGEPVRLHGSFVSDGAARRIVDLWTAAYLAEMLKGRVEDHESVAREMVTKDVVDALYDRRKASIKRKRDIICELVTEDVADELFGSSYYEPLPEVRSGAMEEHTRRQKRQARELDEKFTEAARIVARHKEASVSMLQRRLDIGWARAGRIIDQLEEAGIIGPYVGSKSRKVLVENETELVRLLDEVKKGESGA